MKKKIFILFLCLCVAMFSSGLIYGMTSVEVTNEFETGIVDIRIKEFQKVGDKEVDWEDNPLILPGQEVSKIPRIFNDGNDCYIRAKITFRGTTEVDESDLKGISDKWVKADDGFYYYTEIVPHGKSVDVFEALLIPEDFSQEYEGEIFYIDIDADAIQSKNFNPNFKTAKPWGDIEILKCGKEGQYDISSFKQSDTKSFAITYEGKVKELTKNEDDFFMNFPYLMPGDTYNDTLKLENDSSKDIRIYFRSSATDDSELLDKIQLKITTKIDGKEKVYYEGSLRAEDLSKSEVLGIIPSNESGDFNFEIYVPHELNNQYTISSSFVRWIFSTEEISEKESPKTGDETNMIFWVSLIGLSVSAICLVLVVDPKKKHKKESSHE